MENWYPKIFADVKEFNPIKGDYLFVSELLTHEVNGGLQSSRDYQSLLINSDLIKFINPEEINQATDCSVHPIYDKDYEYTGRSSVFISNHKGLENVSPFVFSWESANNFTFQPDPMFLQTYGLTPRLTEKTIHWDDLSRPLMDIVELIPKSVYDFPNYSKSYVKIRKDYLQDYLKLTKKSLIQVYCETRILPFNQELKALLGENQYFEKTTKFNHFRINKISDDEIFTEVTGYRQIHLGDKIPFSKWDKKEKYHIWPGYEEPISRANAKHFNYVYVSDEVLGVYEQDDKFDIYPELGGVRYKNQWSVSRTSRVGRNHIKLELFKLYEGTPSEVIAYWNKFAVDKSKIDFEVENIAIKSKRLVDTYLNFAEWLSETIFNSFEIHFFTEQLIKLNKEELNYYGWYTIEAIKPITYHLPHKLSKQDFLYRTKKLHHFLIENLIEKNLRKIAVDILNIDLEKFKQNEQEIFRSIKLLNFILNYIRIANEAGLNLKNDTIEINLRLETEIVEMELIKKLNAINILRQLDSHQAGSKSDDKMDKAFEIFGLERNEVNDNFLDACEIIYDKTEKEFKVLRKSYTQHFV